MNLVKKLGVLLALVTIALMPVAPALAQEGKKAPGTETGTVATQQPAAPFFGVSIGAGLGAGLVIIGAGMGFARIGSAALESMARQPETAARVQTAMIIIGALLEGATMLALVVCILIATKAGV
jgi:F-type H+-transporting ATPase subunit c